MRACHCGEPIADGVPGPLHRCCLSGLLFLLLLILCCSPARSPLFLFPLFLRHYLFTATCQSKVWWFGEKLHSVVNPRYGFFSSPQGCVSDPEPVLIQAGCGLQLSVLRHENEICSIASSATVTSFPAGNTSLLPQVAFVRTEIAHRQCLDYRQSISCLIQFR
jgi:hypothetical protein